MLSNGYSINMTRHKYSQKEYEIIDLRTKTIINALVYFIKDHWEAVKLQITAQWGFQIHSKILVQNVYNMAIFDGPYTQPVFEIAECNAHDENIECMVNSTGPLITVFIESETLDSIQTFSMKYKVIEVSKTILP